MFGDGHLEAVELKDNESGERRTINVGGVFSFIGATPRTAWLPPEIEADLNEAARAMPNWTSESPTIGEVRILALC
jgi:thioredoxin reductase (NADPH)